MSESMTGSRWLIQHYAACRYLRANGGADSLREISGILLDLEISCGRDDSLAARAVGELSAAVRAALRAVQQ